MIFYQNRLRNAVIRSCDFFAYIDNIAPTMADSVRNENYFDGQEMSGSENMYLIFTF